MASIEDYMAKHPEDFPPEGNLILKENLSPLFKINFTVVAIFKSILYISYFKEIETFGKSKEDKF